MSLKLEMAMVNITTEGFLLGIPFTYERVTLHNGGYTIYNKNKIMPGATLQVADSATLVLAADSIGNKNYMGTIIVYEDDFAENTEGLGTLTSNKQLCYPVMPNGEKEGGAFVVDGVLELRGSFGGEILCEKEGARINVYASTANLEVYSREAAFISQKFTVIYEQTSTAFITTAEGTEDLTQGGIYTSGADGLWK